MEKKEADEIQSQEQVQPAQTEPAPNLSGEKSILKIVVILAVAILLIATGTVLGMQIGKKQIAPKEIISDKNTPTATVSEPTITPVVDETTNWKTYSDNIAKFEIKYPAGWSYSVKTKTKVSYGVNSNEPIYYGNLSFSGPEGQIELVFGDGFGGATCQVAKGAGARLANIKIGDYNIPLCNYKQGEIIYYDSPFGDAGGPRIGNTSYNFSFSYRESSPESKDLILEILSTLKFAD
ncbi:hypothetical protein C4578_00650 [Candidatus Microgenomates bacterium]|jgi:flagellar basal body-associated protein FliL|nr:MAG: hypothetical protein C4578_00650 [Candidatus Microgenomates bacterium]